MRYIGKIKKDYNKEPVKPKKVPKCLRLIVLFLVILVVLTGTASVVVIFNDVLVGNYEMRQFMMTIIDSLFKAYYTVIGII